jgi:CMP/dCMP kinase
VTQTYVVAIDGPVASGKSTVARHLACRLGAVVFDTGLLYRALAWLALERAVSTGHGGELAALASELQTTIRPRTSGSPASIGVLAGERDVTDLLHSERVEQVVSEVARQPLVRAAVLEMQRGAVQGHRAVVVGRDIGTAIFPDALLKVQLEASAEERARRRIAQRHGSPDQAEEVRRAILRRDHTDAGQSAPAADAVYIDTDQLSIEQVVGQIEALVRSRTGGNDAGDSA